MGAKENTARTQAHFEIGELQKMSGENRLQKAVALTIAAGYQLDKEAFEFLSMTAASGDPAEIMNRALRRIADMDEKPLFINRDFLERLIEATEQSREIAHQVVDESAQETPIAQQLTEAKRPFRAIAREIDADLNVISDPSTKMNTNGTVDDYIRYFRDRFKRLEKLLRQRIDVKTAASLIDALKAPSGSKLKIIGMVTDKRESKQRTILTVEDLQGSMTALVPQNASEDTKKKARSLLLDQVVCLSVTKTRGTLLIADDIIFPDVAQRIPRKARDPVCAVLTSDLHIGSAQFNREAFSRFVLWLNGKYGNEQQRQTAAHVKYVLIAGDIVDGVGVYPNQIKELSLKDIHKQYHYAARYIEQIPDYIEVVIIPGNHDASRKAAPQPALPQEYIETLQESRNVHSLGNPSIINVHGVEVLMDHGRGLDDVVTTIPGMDYNHPDKAMKLLLQGRHLAPVYGGKTLLSPENRDFLVMERVPDIFQAGHAHVLSCSSYRGVLIVNSGGWIEQTDYMRRLGISPTPGRVPVVDLQTLEPAVVSFA